MTHPDGREPGPGLGRRARRRPAIDPCALLDPGGAHLPGVPAGTTTEREAPFRCRLDIEDYEGWLDQVYLTILDLPTEERLQLSTEPIGGIRSYRMTEEGACTVYLPVSFRLAVQITAKLDEDVAPCDAADAVAQQVDARLSASEQVESEPCWDACPVLAAALNVDMAEVSAVSRSP